MRKKETTSEVTAIKIPYTKIIHAPANPCPLAVPNKEDTIIPIIKEFIKTKDEKSNFEKYISIGQLFVKCRIYLFSIKMSYSNEFNCLVLR